jgi:uridine kinase
MDDFYQPTSRRSATPSPGENFDRERVAVQVLDPLAHGHDGRYQRYDWDVDTLAEWHDVPAGSPVVVEGIYSTSKPLADYFGFRIWVDAPYETRLARGIARDGEAMRSKWVDEWMPAEDVYLREERPRELAHLVVDGGGTESDPVFYVISWKDGGA